VASKGSNPVEVEATRSEEPSRSEERNLLKATEAIQARGSTACAVSIANHVALPREVYARTPPVAVKAWQPRVAGSAAVPWIEVAVLVFVEYRLVESGHALNSVKICITCDSTSLHHRPKRPER
jgi:hypothetical protein